jgi:prolyl oligopeptidase
VILTSSRRTTDCRTRASTTSRKAIDGTPEEFLDPNKFSADGTSTLSAFSLSKDGKYLAYGISQGGSDWVTLKVMEVAIAQRPL